MVAHLLNGAALVILLIGLPMVCSKQLGGLRLSSVSLLQQLTVAGFLLVIGLNLAAYFFVVRRPPTRRLVLRWTVSLGALLVVEWLIIQGYLHFDWLRNGLIWLKDRLAV